MLNTDDIAAHIRAGLSECQNVQVKDLTGTGDHFEAHVVSSDFQGLSMIQQHQKVYKTLEAWLKTGELHALALRTYTPEQWSKFFKL